jgi:pyruvate formate lyase activating enzyme
MNVQRRSIRSETLSPGAVGLSLAEELDARAVRGTLWRNENGKIRCVACGHRCLIAPGRRGICRVRFNENGELRVPFGYVAGVQCDPVEKKPFYHVHPGSDALTFGMLGCDFHCSYCQNWVTSQALRDPAATAPIKPVSADALARAAVELGAGLVVSSYNEPLITAEWAVAVFEKALAAGIPCAFVSNGNATAEALDFLRPWIVAYKIDLKSFDDRKYRTLGGTLDRVTEAIGMVHARGIWLEVLTLVVPGFNDHPEELRSIARFLASISPEIPWHVTAFHKDYRMTDPPNTEARKLIQASEIGAEEGLKFVYAGNAPGRVGRWENTYCPGCGDMLIGRFGYLVTQYRLTSSGACPGCGASVPGLWPREPETRVPRGQGMADYLSRLPRRVQI